MVDFYQEQAYPYTLGRGKLRIRAEGETVWQDLFHIKEFKISSAVDELEHENFSSGIKRVDRTAILKQKTTFSFVADTVVKENIQLFLLALEVESIAQLAGTWTAEPFTCVETNKWQELGKKKITMTAITDDSVTPVPLVLHTDYEADWMRGLILLLSGGMIAATDDFKITGTYPNYTRYRIKGGTKPTMKYHLWFSGDPAEGVKQDIIGWGLLRPSGDLSMIGDEWQSFTVEGSFMSHSTYGALGFMYEDLEHV